MPEFPGAPSHEVIEQLLFAVRVVYRDEPAEQLVDSVYYISARTPDAACEAAEATVRERYQEQTGEELGDDLFISGARQLSEDRKRAAVTYSVRHIDTSFEDYVGMFYPPAEARVNDFAASLDGADGDVIYGRAIVKYTGGEDEPSDEGGTVFEELFFPVWLPRGASMHTGAILDDATDTFLGGYFEHTLEPERLANIEEYHYWLPAHPEQIFEQRFDTDQSVDAYVELLQQATEDWDEEL